MTEASAAAEYDLDSLAAMLDDDDDDDEEGWTASSSCKTSSCEKTPDNLVDMDGEDSLLPSQMVEENEYGSLKDLGLEMSDEEEAQPSTSCKSSSFSAAFASSKFAKHGESKSASQNHGEDIVDPLESELRMMEERMNAIKQQLAKKKLNSSDVETTSKKFIKLTNVCPDSKHSVRTLTDQEESKLYEKYGKKSKHHTGETDSEDEEDMRNPFEQKYNSCGREIKRRLAHQSNQSSCSSEKAEILSRIKNNESQSQKIGWKSTGGSLVSLKNNGAVKPSTENEKDFIVDSYSNLRIINPLVSQETMRERMDSRKMVRLSTITLHLRGGDIEGDWVTIGVLVSKSDPKTSQKGSHYSIWKLSDLQDCTKTVALFLFSAAHKNLWKHSIGTVIGLLNPTVMKDRQGDKNTDILTLSIYDSNKVMLMGSSKDLGWCKGRTKTNGFCKYFVNKASCEFCIYHIQREYQKSSSKRAEIQSNFTRVDPKRRLQQRVLGKDQVFYGGQLYTAPSPGTAPKQKNANHAKDLATLSSLKLKLKSQELKEEDKNNSFVLKHMSYSEIDAVKKVAQTSENLSEKLLAPTPGARNLLRHMAKEETNKMLEKGEIRSISAKELLAMTHKKVRSQSTCRVSSPSMGPKLGRGLKPGNDIDLEISPPPPSRINPAKAKALAVVQARGGIQAAKPNAVRNVAKASDPEFQDKVRKRLSTSSHSDDEKQISKRSKLLESMPAESPRVKLGSVDVNSDKFKAMLAQTSRHVNLVDSVENEAMEKYYQGLEKKEMLEEKMASIMEIPTTAYVCIKCKYMAQSASDFCREENHPLKAIKAKKRFFECKNCKRRTSSLDKLPRNPCSNCDQSSWQRVSMGKAKSGPKLPSEILSLRGDELKHYSGGGDKVYLHI